MDYHNYFITLEDKFKEISKYVEIDTRNYRTFSSEITLLFLAACSEFEVVAKEICKIIDEDIKIKIEKGKWVNIEDICKSFTSDCSEIFDEIVDVPKFGLKFTPFENWKNGNSPAWWRNYNKVKHHRSKAYNLANLENLLFAMSSLQIVNYYLIWKRDCPNKSRDAPVIHLKSRPNVFFMDKVNYFGPVSADDLFEI